MLLADVLAVIERLAPSRLAQEWDNSGLQVGNTQSEVERVLVALDLDEAVLAEAESLRCDTIVTHHPLLFKPVISLVESRPREALLRRLVAGERALVACHTNLDAAEGGLAEIAGDALGLEGMHPLIPAAAGWSKLVAYIPCEALDMVASQVFAAGAGGMGRYSDCAFAVEGKGWFTPRTGSRPTVGVEDVATRSDEIRWETVVPKSRVGAAVRALVSAHPYEEPAFDLYPVEDVLGGVGVGRVGSMSEESGLRELAERVAALFESHDVRWTGDEGRPVTDVAVLPGSGRGGIEHAAGRCDVLITGDLSYHDAQEASENGLALVDVPHGDIEWWAFRKWSKVLEGQLAEARVKVIASKEWGSPWSGVK